jgi:hypothetical protein
MSALRIDARDGRVTVRGDVRLRRANTQTYSEWDWDGARLHVANCPLGMHPLYWREYPHGIGVATTLFELLDESVVPDYPALAVFLRLGWFVGEDTPFKGIAQLPPNSMLEWTPERGAQLHVGARPHAARISIGSARAMRIYGELFDKAVRRCLPVTGRFVLPLSGGRDSRHIALALHEAGVRPAAFGTLKHLPGRADEDARVAALLAHALDVPHVVLEQPRFYVHNIARLLRDTALCADDGAQMYPLIDWLKANADTTFDGIAGDMMSTNVFQHGGLAQLCAAGDLDATARELFRRWSPTVRGWQHAVDADTAQALSDEVAHRRLMTELERHRDNHNPLRSFFFWNRTRREIALQPFLTWSGLRVETPFLDAELWHFLESLPYDIVGNSSFHTDTIRRAYPRFADIPFEDMQARKPPTRFERMCLGADLARALMKEGGAARMRQLPRCARLLAGARVWWKPGMLLYMLALKDAARAPVPARHAAGA